MSIELDRVDRPDERHPTSAQPYHHPAAGLAPADKGAGAWLFLFGSFLIEAVIWGFNIAFSVFQEHYSRLPQFLHNPNIPAIGTAATSIVFLGTPFAAPLIGRFHAWRLAMVIVGSVICVLSLVWASFANSIRELIASQGILYGIGVLVVYAPLVSILNEWFVERRGLAYGVVFAGCSVSGLQPSPLLESYLESWSNKTDSIYKPYDGICLSNSGGKIFTWYDEEAAKKYDFLQHLLSNQAIQSTRQKPNETNNTRQILYSCKGAQMGYRWARKPVPHVQ